jgi:hypothetical protein
MPAGGTCFACAARYAFLLFLPPPPLLLLLTATAAVTIAAAAAVAACLTIEQLLVPHQLINILALVLVQRLLRPMSINIHTHAVHCRRQKMTIGLQRIRL